MNYLFILVTIQEFVACFCLTIDSRSSNSTSVRTRQNCYENCQNYTDPQKSVLCIRLHHYSYTFLVSFNPIPTSVWSHHLGIKVIPRSSWEKRVSARTPQLLYAFGVAESNSRMKDFIYQVPKVELCSKETDKTHVHRRVCLRWLQWSKINRVDPTTAWNLLTPYMRTGSANTLQWAQVFTSQLSYADCM